MTREEKMNLQRRANRRNVWQRLGFLSKLLLTIPLLVLYAIGANYVYDKQDAAIAFVDSLTIPAPLPEFICHHLLQCYLLAGGVAIVTLLVYPFHRRMVSDGCLRIALTNAAGETPTLLRERKDRKNPRVRIWTLRNPGIALRTWEDKQLDLEAVFNINIIGVSYGKGTERIVLKFVYGRNALPEYIVWKRKYLSPESFVLVLGEGYTGPITVDLAAIPHILLGGSTGSGKSVLLKLLLMQSLQKGAMVYIADFKGGVDFPPVWHEKCQLYFDEDALLELLTSLVDELERRKMLFKETGSPNLDAYNKATRAQLKRCIFACDEVAEVLDKTGLSAEEKKLISQIESKLSIIARQGRAFGVHLILATQRPDANLIPGQIRTNLGCRICGRADNILSQIILDSTAAADQIPKESRGRFLLHDGTLFQGYWFDEMQM